MKNWLSACNYLAKHGYLNDLILILGTFTKLKSSLVHQIRSVQLVIARLVNRFVGNARALPFFQAVNYSFINRESMEKICVKFEQSSSNSFSSVERLIKKVSEKLKAVLLRSQTSIESEVNCLSELVAAYAAIPLYRYAIILNLVCYELCDDDHQRQSFTLSTVKLMFKARYLYLIPEYCNGREREFAIPLLMCSIQSKALADRIIADCRFEAGDNRCYLDQSVFQFLCDLMETFHSPRPSSSSSSSTNDGGLDLLLQSQRFTDLSLLIKYHADASMSSCCCSHSTGYSLSRILELDNISFWKNFVSTLIAKYKSERGVRETSSSYSHSLFGRSVSLSSIFSTTL